ncbi:carboxylesterase family protein [Klebsiella aerogenes]|uniref:carboxylesterase family protein n=1 Tax=Klebsiella aerogenes TaxID=548 RepID=UPI000667FB33|nr:carboxylesterase family protein [Klebsiella aerogenes]
MKSNILKLGLTITLLALCIKSATASDLLVNTHAGKVLGIEKNGVKQWTGIPYARPPVGKLRWRAPQPLFHWNSIFDARKAAQDCIQATATGTKGVEDCLNLNIYRPAKESHNLPVLIYIHGGNNQTGSSGDFNPNFIAKHLHAVIVTVNYRLGALGFNPLSALNTGDKQEDSGNYALLDLKQSLVWVKNNIKLFGGDNNNITISGFSAGGRDVMAMLISPIFTNTFNKAIVFSGGMTTSDKQEAQNIFVQRIAHLVVADGIKRNLSEAQAWLMHGGQSVKHYLYQLPPNKIAMLFGDAGIRMHQFPHIYRDGYVIPKVGFNTTIYNSVPLIMLTGQNEFSLFARNDSFFSRAIHNNTFNDDSSLVDDFRFVNYYGGKLYSLFNVERSAEKMFKHYQAPIYGTEIHFGTDPFITGRELAPVGSYHGIFLAFWDPAVNANFIQHAMRLRGAKDLTTTFNNYLRNFLIKGKPENSKTSQWLPWTPDNVKKGQSILMMDANKEHAITWMSSKDYTSDDVITAIEKDHSVTDTEKQKLVTHVLSGRWFSSELDEHFNNHKSLSQ